MIQQKLLLVYFNQIRSKVAYLIFQNLVYRAQRSDDGKLRNIGDKMDKVANFEIKDEKDKNIGYKCCNPTNLREDTYMWSSEVNRTNFGKVNVKDEIKQYPNEAENPYLNICMDAEHEALIEKARITNEESKNLVKNYYLQKKN